MEKQDYLDRIDKCNAKIEKLERKIQKHTANKTLEKFIKENGGYFCSDWNDAKNCHSLEELAQQKYDRDHEYCETHGYDISLDSCLSSVQDSYDRYIREQDTEIRHATEDIEATKITIKKYQNAIQLIDEKSAKPVIQIFKDFFDGWKEKIISWVTPRVERYYELNSKSCQMYNNRYNLIGPGKEYETKEDWQKAYKEINEEERYLRDGFVAIALDKGFRYNPEDFIKFLDKYMEDRYFELVDKVTKYTGEITDVSNLHIGADGSLNGKVYGVDGGAKIETIGAGGYNIQCYHYRCLIHPLH